MSTLCMLKPWKVKLSAIFRATKIMFVTLRSQPCNESKKNLCSGRFNCAQKSVTVPCTEDWVIQYLTVPKSCTILSFPKNTLNFYYKKRTKSIFSQSLHSLDNFVYISLYYSLWLYRNVIFCVILRLFKNIWQQCARAWVFF